MNTRSSLSSKWNSNNPTHSVLGRSGCGEMKWGSWVFIDIFTRHHPISSSPKVFLILDDLSFPFASEKLAIPNQPARDPNRKQPARVPDQTRPIPSHASAHYHSSSFQLVPARFETLSTHVKKMEMQVVQTGDAIRRQEASTRGVGDDVMKHHVNAIIEDDFWKVVKEEKLQEGDFEVESLMSFSGSHWYRSTPDTEHRSIYTNTNRSTGTPEHRSTTPTESTASCNAVKILTHEEFAAKHSHPPSPDQVRIDRHANSNVYRHSEANIDQQPSPPIDRRAPITYRVQMPNIDVARLNALRPKPKPSEQPLEPVRTPLDDGDDPMEEDRVSTGITLRRRKEKVAKHLKRGVNEKEKENFQKRVFRIPLHKPFEEAYYTHRLWMFFIETREKEEDIRRMFCETREKMRMRITLKKKKSDPGQFEVPCTVKGIEFPHPLCDTGASVSILPRVMADHLGMQVEPSQELFTFVDCSQKNSGGIVRDLEVQIGNALVPVDFHVLDIKLNWNSSLLLGRAFLSTVGAVCNLQTNQLCLTLIDPNAHYDPIPVKPPQTIPRRINDPGIIAACHCGAEYKSDYSESIDTHPVTSIDTHQHVSGRGIISLILANGCC
ncbi:hypothetical protein F2Q69_00030045 [Brassica cretica]|uniref:Aspartic peptidase DDI1-type domain-containing protein n=1 Tax=Brassica cretica TaxID=69181 RepID=A0A8S9S4J9_BRACR|nr:hypothetical protein F2Q69_00030045 [Brassica cretica]